MKNEYEKNMRVLKEIFAIFITVIILCTFMIYLNLQYREKILQNQEPISYLLIIQQPEDTTVKFGSRAYFIVKAENYSEINWYVTDKIGIFKGRASDYLRCSGYDTQILVVDVDTSKIQDYKIYAEINDGTNYLNTTAATLHIIYQ